MGTGDFMENLSEVDEDADDFAGRSTPFPAHVGGSTVSAPGLFPTVDSLSANLPPAYHPPHLPADVPYAPHLQYPNAFQHGPNPHLPTYATVAPEAPPMPVYGSSKVSGASSDGPWRKARVRPS